MEDASNATAAGSDTQDIITHYLWATQFGFNIPSSAVINGIVASAKRKKSASGTVNDYSVRLIKNGAVTGDNKADTGTNWPTSLTWKDYGSGSDPWNAGLTPGDVNSNNLFGYAFSAKLVMNAIPPQAAVDNMHITVYYTVPSKGAGIALGSMQPMIFQTRHSKKLVLKPLNLPLVLRRF